MPMTNAFRAARFVPESFAPGLTHHVFLIAIRGEAQSSLVHRGNLLQPMQVIATGPGDMLPLATLEAAIGPVPALPPPHRPMRNVNPSARLMLREITGEILRDAGGMLYEKVDDSVRPVNQLFTGPRGEMIDLTPMREMNPDAGAVGASQRPQWGLAGASGEPPVAEPGDDDPDAEPHPDAAFRSAEQRGARPLRELARRLVPEPGLWRLVRYADFIDAITPQLADPRRLQPGHQLACYLQVYELGTTVPTSALDDAAARELGKVGKLMPLSYDLCRRFGLSLPRPAFALAAARQVHSPGMAPAGARFITLRVALDPTAEAIQPAAATVPSSAGTPGTEALLNAAMAPTTSGLKTAIPEEFIKPWELRLSRDEVLYDMALAASRGPWRRLLDHVLRRIAGRDMKKWHALLFGKTPDQQLWAITPPQGGAARRAHPPLGRTDAAARRLRRRENAGGVGNSLAPPRPVRRTH
jgi:hypothetical protein